MPSATNAQQISALYASFFNRAPDAEGLAFWEAQFENGATAQDIAAGFANHPVFEETYEGTSNLEFVQQLYVNALGAAGDNEGILYWYNRLEAGEDRAQVVSEFVTGALTIDLETLRASGSLSQADYEAAVERQNAITNKADVGIHFAQKFGEASNLSPETDPFSRESLESDPAYMAAQAAIRSVTADTASVVNAIAAIDTAAAQENPQQWLIDNAPEGPDLDEGEVFTLTTDAGEQVNGTTSNDTIRAVLDSTTAANGTLNIGDVVDGKAGFDTLELIATGTNTALPAGASISNVEQVNLTLGEDGSTINAAQFGNAVQQLWLKGQASNATVNGLAASTTLGLTATGAMGAIGVDVGSAASLSLALDGLDASRTITATGTGTTLKTINVSGNGVDGANGANPDLVLNNANVTTLNLALSGEIDIEAQGLTALTTVNASESDADLQIDLAGIARNITVTGGSGDDYIIFGDHFNAQDVVDGGEGEDTVQINLGGTMSTGERLAVNALTNVETLFINDEVTALDASQTTSVNTIGFGDDAVVTGITDEQTIVGGAGANQQVLWLSHADSTATGSAGTVNVTSMSLLNVALGVNGFETLVADGQGMIIFDNTLTGEDGNAPVLAAQAAKVIDLSAIALDADDNGEVDTGLTSAIRLNGLVTEQVTLSEGRDVIDVSSSTVGELGTTFDSITGFTVGGDYADTLVISGFNGAFAALELTEGTTSLGQALEQAAASADQYVYFELNGNTYLYGDTDAAGATDQLDDGDFAVELVGSINFEDSVVGTAWMAN